MITPDLDAALRLAGYTLAHAALSVSTGETLCTLAIVQDGDDRPLFRFEASSIPESVELGHQFLTEEMGEGHLAALAFDADARADDGARSDALCIEVMEVLQFELVTLGEVVQPYRPGRQRFGRFGPVTGFEVLGEPFLAGRLALDEAASREVIRQGFLEHPQGPALIPPRD